MLRRVGVMVEVRRALYPAGVARLHFIAAAFAERLDLIHLLQFMDRGAPFLREIEIVRRQLVLGVASAADHAVAAVAAPATPGPFTTEIGIVSIDAGRAEIHTDRSAVVRVPFAHVT